MYYRVVLMGMLVLSVLMAAIPQSAIAQLYPDSTLVTTFNGENSFDDVVVDMQEQGGTLYVLGLEVFEIQTGGGELKRAVLQKFDSTGSLIAEGVFPPPESTSFFSTEASDLTLLNNGFSAICGVLLRDTWGNQFGFMAVFDQNFVLQGMHTYQGTRTDYNELFMLTFDPVNEVIYAAGIIAESDANFVDAVLIKYNLQAQPSWPDTLIRYQSEPLEQTKGLCVDDVGNIYHIVDLYSDVVTLSYFPDGTLRWQAVYNQFIVSWINEVKIDSENNIYVAGYVITDAPDYLWCGLCLKYSADGSPLDTLIYEFDDGAIFNRIAFDSQNNLYLTGYTVPLDTALTEAVRQLLVLKYSSDGDTLWSFIWGDSLYHLGDQIAVDRFDRPIIVDVEGFNDSEYKNYLMVLDKRNGNLVGHIQTLNVSDFPFDNSTCLLYGNPGYLYFGGAKQYLGQGLNWLTIRFIPYIAGDANGDGRVIGADVTFLVCYFRNIGSRPWPFWTGDANGDGRVIGADVTFLVCYFRGIHPAIPYLHYILEEWL